DFYCMIWHNNAWVF
nr:immunoglobulin light chain junction region [Macaca mulatta]MOY08426.1 immunoglobulin light chain junction region [Macaca mulatta]